MGQAIIGLKHVNAWVHTYTKPQTSSTRSRGLGWRIHESVEDTKLSTNKRHTLSLCPAIPDWENPHIMTRRVVFQCMECMEGFGTLMDVLKHQGRPRRLHGGLASFKGVFVSEQFSFVSYHHADFSYPWHLFHTQMSFFHTCCNIFIPFWYISKRMVCNLSGSVPP